MSESDTNYILHIWRIGAFGNIKLFERRINTRNKDLSIEDFKFLKGTEYIYMRCSIGGQYLKLVFNTSSAFKDPLMLQPECEVKGVMENYLVCFD